MKEQYSQVHSMNTIVSGMRVILDKLNSLMEGLESQNESWIEIDLDQRYPMACMRK